MSIESTYSLPVHERKKIKLIKKLAPNFFEKISYSLYGFVKTYEYFHPKVRTYKKMMRRVSKLKPLQLRKIKLYKLKKLLYHAYQKVPYYRILFEQIDFHPSQIRRLEDIQKVPILTKEIVRKEYSNLISTDSEKYQPILNSTGGTTGKPLNFLIDKNQRYLQLAEKFFHWENFGYKIRDRMVVLRSRVLDISESPSNEPWRFDWIQNILYLSSYHLNEKMMSKYFELIKYWKPKYMQAYPSSAYEFANFIKEKNLKLDIGTIFTSSEILPEYVRKLIESVFSGRVIDHYGHGEPGVWITSQCNCGFYKPNPFTSLFEVELGSKNYTFLGKGPLVETCLTNFSMPFIRYKIGDIARISSSCCDLGNSEIISELLGREADTITISDRKISGAILHNQVSKNIIHIKNLQIIQKNSRELLLNVVPTDEFKNIDKEKIIKEFRDRIGSEINIEINLVSKLKIPQSGKLRYVISKLDVK